MTIINFYGIFTYQQIKNLNTLNQIYLREERFAGRIFVEFIFAPPKKQHTSQKLLLRIDTANVILQNYFLRSGILVLDFPKFAKINPAEIHNLPKS